MKYRKCPMCWYGFEEPDVLCRKCGGDAVLPDCKTCDNEGVAYFGDDQVEFDPCPACHGESAGVA